MASNDAAARAPSGDQAPTGAGTRKPAPVCVLRGSKKSTANPNQYDTTVLLFKGESDYLTGFVVVNGKKRHVLAHINEREPNKETGEVKPNFLVLSELETRGEDGEDDKWNEIGYGNAMNRRSDGKPVYFDQVLFNVDGELLSARVTAKVDQELHRRLGFEQGRVPRAKADKREQAAGTDPAPTEADSPAAPAPAVSG